jgi:hypothetical protein
MIKRALFSTSLGVGLLALTACLPAQLDKYRNKDGASKDERASDTVLAPGDGSEVAPQTSPSARQAESTKSQSQTAQARPQKDAPPRATIYAIDKQTFRIALKDTDVWDAALNVLLRNYNLNIVDRNSGIITTEWDSYYLNKEVYRNKLSLRVAKSSYSSVDVTIHNNVEKLRDASQAAGTVGAVWLPAADPANEVGRVIQNMALVLNQPPPVLPPNAAPLARGERIPEELR